MNKNCKDILFIIIVCSCIGVIRSLIIQDISIIKSSPEVINIIPEFMYEPMMIDTDLSKEIFNDGVVFIDARDNEV